MEDRYNVSKKCGSAKRKKAAAKELFGRAGANAKSSSCRDREAIEICSMLFSRVFTASIEQRLEELEAQKGDLSLNITAAGRLLFFIILPPLWLADFAGAMPVLYRLVSCIVIDGVFGRYFFCPAAGERMEGGSVP